MDASNEQWSSLPSMGTKRGDCAAVPLGGKIIVVGGYGDSGRLSSVEEFNYKTRQWSSLPSMGTKRSSCAAVSLGDKIIVVGGNDGSSYLSSVEEFNYKTRRWSSLPSMGTKRYGCAAVPLGDKIIVVGGYDGRYNRLSSVEEFNYKTRQWSSLPSMGTKCVGCAAVPLGDKVVVVGGNDGSSRLSSVEEFDFKTRQWSSLPSMGTKRSSCAAVSLGDKIIVVGGWDGRSYLSSAESLSFKPPLHNFYKKLLEKDNRNIHFKIEELTGLVDDVHQMKFLYTLINTFYHLGNLELNERKDYITRSLRKVSKTTKCTDSVTMFKLVLDKALRDQIIDDYSSEWLDREAEVTHTSHASFVKEIWNNFDVLEARMDQMDIRMDQMDIRMDQMDIRMDQMDSRMDHIETRVDKLEVITADAVDSLRKLQEGIRFQRKADAAAGMMTAILNAVSFGIAGSAVQGILGTAVNSIVDFGDLSHIQSVVESFGDIAVKDVLEAGIKVGEGCGDEAVFKAAKVGKAKLSGPLYDELYAAADEGNPLFAIAVTAQVIRVEQMASGAAPREKTDHVGPQTSMKQSGGTQSSVTSLPSSLIDATTEQICEWLSNRGISKASLDVIQREEIDGFFLFEESMDDVKTALKDEGIKLGQLSRICKAIEEAKEKGSLV